MRCINWILLLFLVSSCNKSFEINEYKKKETVLFNSKAVHFSDPENFDYFIIKLTGKDVLNSQFEFLIINSIQDTLFYEKGESEVLIGYGLIGNEKSVDSSVAYITNRVNTFLDEKNFRSPAIRLDESYDSDYSDSIAWHSVKQNEHSVSFYFIIGEENMRWIAFSVRLNKVVVIHSCC